MPPSIRYFSTTADPWAFPGAPLSETNQALTDRMAFLCDQLHCPVKRKDFAMSFLVLKAYLN